MDEPAPLEQPIDGTLDLHTFKPSDVKLLLHDYFEACRKEAITTVRVVHGKGTGTLRETVHAQLRQMPGILAFGPADESAGGWGATFVYLDPAYSCE